MNRFDNKLALLQWLLLLAATVLSPLQNATAQSVFHVRAGATGANNGLDWGNAYTSFPASLTRGATYYVAAGNYPSWVFSTPVSGTNVITIRKATLSDHGTSIGWSDAYSGQSRFTGPLSIHTSYWVFDGVTGGGPGSWTNNFGFYMRTDQTGIFAPIDGASDITVEHFEIEGHGDDGDGDGYPPNDMIFFMNNNTTSQIHNNIHLSHLYLHDNGGNSITLVQVQNSIIEYCYVARNEATTGEHAEGVYGYPSNANNTARWSIWEDIEGTGVIMISGDNWKVYGNLIFATGRPQYSGLGNGSIAGWSHDYTRVRNAHVYNNTIINCNRGWNAGIIFPVSDGGNYCYNNLFVDNILVNNGGATADYSLVMTSGQYNRAANDVVTQVDPSIFVDYQNRDYRLARSTAGGLVVEDDDAKRDMFGNLRGADGVWDRGAFEFVSGLRDTNGPSLSNVAVTGIAGNWATIVWDTDEHADSVVDYGVTTSYGLSVKKTEFVLKHSVTVSNLNAEVTYDFRVSSTDRAGNESRSGNHSFRTTQVDTTAPTVTLIIPQGEQVLSETRRLAARAEDNPNGSGIGSVEFWVSGRLVGVGKNTNNTEYYLYWNSRTVTNGTHVIVAKTIDNAGNVSESQPAMVVIKNESKTGVIARLCFDEGTGDLAKDSSGYGNDGKLINGVGWGEGRVSNAVSFDGTDDYVNVQSSTSLESATNEVSVSAWIKIEQNGQWQAVVRKVLQEGTHIYPYSGYDLMIENSGGGFKVRMSVSRSDSTRGSVYGDSVLNFAQWYHVAGVYDGAAVKIYINGVFEESIQFSGAIVQTKGQPLLIGRNGEGGDILKGYVDSLRIYNRALTEAEVLSLFYEESTGLVVPKAPHFTETREETGG